MSTTAHADVCGSGLDLPAHTWTMFSAPCAPPAGSESVAAQFDADLSGTYDTTWIMRKWNPDTKKYETLQPADELKQGTGYWIYSYNPGTLKIDNGTHTTGITATGGADGYYGDCAAFGWAGQPCYKIDLAVPASGQTKANMVGFPFVRSAKWAEVRVAHSTDGGVTWTNERSPSDAEVAGLINKTIYVYNEVDKKYDSFDDTSGSGNNLLPNKAYWIQTKNQTATTNISLLIPAPPYYVFVTSTTTTGAMGGLAGADQMCQQRALAAGRTGLYLAWLSSASYYARNRLDHAGPYYNTNNAKIATSWTDLTDGRLAQPIEHDESGVLMDAQIWTGTTPDGRLSDPRYTCADWTDDKSGYGDNGYSRAIDDSWTTYLPWGYATKCAYELGIICVLQ
jgi:hypothetical protein